MRMHYNVAHGRDEPRSSDPRRALQAFDPTVKAIVQTHKQMDATLAAARGSKTPLSGYSAVKRKMDIVGPYRDTTVYRMGDGSAPRGWTAIATGPAPRVMRMAPSTALAVYDMNLQRLRALKSQFEQTYDPLVRFFAHRQQQQQQQPQAVNAVLPGAAAAPDGLPMGSTPMFMRVLDALPKQCHNKYTALNQYLVENPGTVRVSLNGRPVIDGKELDGPTFVDAMRSLYVWRKR